MKVLIVYSTKWGVSRRCAEMLGKKLESFANVLVCDVKDEPPAPVGFDVAVIGGSIRMGTLNKKLKKYIKQKTFTVKIRL